MTVSLTPVSLTVTDGAWHFGECLPGFLGSSVTPSPGTSVARFSPGWSATGWMSANGVAFPADGLAPEIRMSDDDEDEGGDDDGDEDAFDDDGIELDDDTLAPTELEEFDEDDFDDEFDDDFEEEPEDEFGSEFGEPDSISELGIPDGDPLDEELSDGVDAIEPLADLKADVPVVDDEEEDGDAEEEVV